MIEVHDDVPLNHGQDPFEDALDYTQRMQINQNESLMELIRSLDANIERLANYNPRQLNKEAPTLLDMGPLAGKLVPGANNTSWQTTQKFRVTNIIYGGGAVADELRLSIATTSYHFYTSGNTISLDFEIEIDRGLDISVIDFTTPANRLWTFMIFGYPE